MFKVGAFRHTINAIDIETVSEFVLFSYIFNRRDIWLDWSAWLKISSHQRTFSSKKIPHLSIQLIRNRSRDCFLSLFYNQTSISLSTCCKNLSNSLTKNWRENFFAEHSFFRDSKLDSIRSQKIIFFSDFQFQSYPTHIMYDKHLFTSKSMLRLLFRWNLEMTQLISFPAPPFADINKAADINKSFRKNFKGKISRDGSLWQF